MKPIFRSAMFGFHKDDVFNFITKQNKQYDTKISELNAEIARQSSDFQREREQLEEELSQLESLRSEAEQSRELILLVSDIISKISLEKTSISACADALRAEQFSLNSKVAEMQAQVREAEKLRFKAEKFDQLSGVLSSIFNQPEFAPESADSVCSDVVSDADYENKTLDELSVLLDNLSEYCSKLQSLLADHNING